MERINKLILAAALLLSGCAATPYAEVGLGYQIDKHSDWYVRTERPWQGRNPQFHLEVGVKSGRYRCGYHHQSWLLSGGSFNHNPEVYADDIRCTLHIGK